MAKGKLLADTLCVNIDAGDTPCAHEPRSHVGRRGRCLAKRCRCRRYRKPRRVEAAVPLTPTERAAPGRNLLHNAIRLLRELEWAATVDDSKGGYNSGCPVCEGTEPGSGDEEYEGHTTTCRLSTFLYATKDFVLSEGR